MTGTLLTVLQFIDPLLPLLLTLMIHSTVVLGVALILSFAMRFRGILAQAFVLRMFLVAVLAAPVIVTFGSLPVNMTVEIPFTADKREYTQPTVLRDNNFSLPFAQNQALGLPERSADAPPSAGGNARSMFDQEPLHSLRTQPFDGANDLKHSESGLRDITMLMLLRMFAAFWILLGAAAIARVLAAHVVLFYMRRSAQPAPENIRILCAFAARKVGVRCPGLLVSTEITSPILSGWLKPVILLPDEWDEKPDMIQQVLLHELYHLAQRDTFWNLIRELGTALYPLQPLMRILSRRLETLSDYACDAFVMERLPNNGTYIDNLLAVAGRHLEEKYGITLHAGFFKRGSLLRRRIRRLLTGREGELLPITCTRVAVVTAVCAGTVMASVTLAVEYERPDTTPFSLQAVVAQATDSVVQAGRQYAEQVVEAEKKNVDEKITRTVAEKPDQVRDRKQNMTDTLSVSQDSNKPERQEHKRAAQRTKHIPDASQAYMAGKEKPSNNDKQVSYPGSTDLNSTAKDERTQQTDSQYSAFSDTTATGWESWIDSLKTRQTMVPMMTGGVSSAITPFEVKLPVAKEINVVMNYDFDTEDLALADDDERYLYSIYFGLEKRKNEPAWSPDGTEIAFTDNNRIWIVPVDGGEPEMVYENLCQSYSIGGVESVCYSTDGTEITFKRFVYDESRGSMIHIIDQSYVSFNNPASDIESVNLKTGESRVLVRNGYSCDWSPDGSMLVYLGSPDGAQFKPGIDTEIVPMVLDTASGGTRALTEPGTLRYGVPSFSHDGTEIYVTAREGNGPVNLYRIPVSGGDPVCLTEYSADNGYGKYRNYPDCSPDGRWVLYTDQTSSKDEPGQRLFLYEISTGGITPFFTEPEYARSYGAWSPAGNRICYVESRDDGNYLYIASFDRYDAEKAAGGEEEPQYAFSLSQNYPNPFNSTTVIEFSIPEESMVDLRIYNILGQQVRTLISDTITAGNHVVRWDGRSDSGNSVGSGVYVSVLHAGGKREIKRMTCLR